jgi:hypothetical protein
MTAEPSSRPDLVVLGAIGIATCCALPVLVAITAALGVGSLGAWVLTLGAGAVAAVLLVRLLRRRGPSEHPAPQPASPQTRREE